MVPNVPNWLFSACAFISFVLCMIPLSWHLEAWHTGICMFMIWRGVDALNQFINSVVWNSDTINRAPVWCDISTQIILAAWIGVPASSLCISRRLYQIASIQSVIQTRAEKRRGVMIDLAIGVGIPLLELALHPIVQSHRFVIVEEVGCFPSTLNTPASYVIFYSWPIIISLVSAFYAVRTIRELAIRRAQFKEFLSTNRNLSFSRYFRLMGLAGVQILFSIPLSIVTIYLNLTTTPLQPWESWDHAHANYSEIAQLSSSLWHDSTANIFNVELSRWSVVLCSFVFFAFFGFADEARRNYRLAYAYVTKRMGLSSGTWTANSTSPDSSLNSRSGTMRVYITQQTERKRESFTSLSSRMSFPFPDVGGAFAYLRKRPFSPASSASMSREQLPRPSVDWDNVPLPRLPQAAFDMGSPPRHTPDVPCPI